MAADTEAAKMGSRFVASALVKIHGFSAVWLTVREGMKDAIEHGKSLINGSTLFVTIVNELDRGELLKCVSEDGPAHPTDTHPPLTQRLENVKINLADVLDEASRTSPDMPASSLFGETEALEAELTDAEQVVMVKTGEATPNIQVGARAPLTEVDKDKLSRSLCPGCDAYNAWIKDIPANIQTCEVCGKQYPLQ